MFENYIHTKEDLEAVEEALEYLERPELDFIFKDRSLIGNTLIISYDSKELFIWTKLKHSKLKKMPCRVKEYNAYRIPHKIKIRDRDQMGWCCVIRPKEINRYLPRKFQKSRSELPKISGGLLTPFTKIHERQRKTKRRPLDAYHTRESYLATIVHEFGHVYYNKHRLWYYGNKKENMSYIRCALSLYQEAESRNLAKFALNFPIYEGISEVFAFCTDYTAASLFWPNHKKDIDRAALGRIRKLLKKERELDLDNQDSVLKECHNLSTTVGKILVKKYPRDWPNHLLALRNTLR